MTRRTTPDRRHIDATVMAATKLLHKLDHRLHAQMQRDRRGGTAIPDGYPASTIGGDGGSEHSSTESAVLRRLDHANDPDEHHRLTWAAWDRLSDVLGDLRLIDAWLAKLEQAGQPRDDADAWCENHLRHGVTEPRDHANRRRTCQWCYSVQREYGELPTKALIDRKARGERLSEQAVTAALGVHRKAG